MVSIVAFQAVDRGSIPRQRSSFAVLQCKLDLGILKSIVFYVLYVFKSCVHLCLFPVGGTPECQCVVANLLCFFLITI